MTYGPSRTQDQQLQYLLWIRSNATRNQFFSGRYHLNQQIAAAARFTSLQLASCHNINMLDKLKEVDRARFNRRKAVKSPINIRKKIKELQQQIEKHQRIKNVDRRAMQDKPNFYVQIHPPVHPDRYGIRERSREKSPVFVKSQGRRQQRTKYERPALAPQQVTERATPNLKRTSESRRVYSPPTMTRRQSDGETTKRFQQKEQGQQSNEYQGLLRQNQRYKQIYNKSVQKLRELEQRLHLMRLQHESEKMELEGAMEELRDKVDQKKTNNLAHIYSYDVKENNFLVVREKIITETDNENSSSHLEPRRRCTSSSALSLVEMEFK